MNNLIDKFILDCPDAKGIKINFYTKESVPKKLKKSVQWDDYFPDADFVPKVRKHKKIQKIEFVINFYMKKPSPNFLLEHLMIFMHELAHCYSAYDEWKHGAARETEREIWFRTMFIFNIVREKCALPINKLMDIMVEALTAYKKSLPEEY